MHLAVDPTGDASGADGGPGGGHPFGVASGSRTLGAIPTNGVGGPGGGGHGGDGGSDDAPR